MPHVATRGPERNQALTERHPKSLLGSHRISYTGHMKAYVISNPVPTPEEMAEILGLSSDRVTAVRRIMSTPSRRKTSGAMTLRKNRRRSTRRAPARTADR